jgi:hypothetical protein
MGVHRVSRSRKKVPIVGATTAESDKVFKVHEHRRERVAVRHALSSETEVPHPKSFGNVWNSQKDGKRFWYDPKALRK